MCDTQIRLGVDQYPSVSGREKIPAPSHQSGFRSPRESLSRSHESTLVCVCLFMFDMYQVKYS